MFSKCVAAYIAYIGSLKAYTPPPQKKIAPEPEIKGFLSGGGDDSPNLP